MMQCLFISQFIIALSAMRGGVWEVKGIDMKVSTPILQLDWLPTVISPSFGIITVFRRHMAAKSYE